MESDKLLKLALKFEKKVIDDSTRKTFYNARLGITTAIDYIASLGKFSGSAETKRFGLESIKLLTKLDSYKHAEDIPSDLWDRVIAAVQSDLYALKNQLEGAEAWLKQGKKQLDKARLLMPKPKKVVEEELSPELHSAKDGK